MKKLVLFFVACLLSALTLQAQPLTEPTPDVMLKVAEEELAKHEYYNALEWFEKYYAEEKDSDVAMQIAELHLMLRDYNKAEKWWGRLVNKRPTRKNPTNKFLPEARFTYGRILKMNGMYAEAVSELQQYLGEAEDPVKIKLAKAELNGAEMALETQEILGLTVDNAGKDLNTKYSEYSPVMSKGDQMYFTAIRQDEVVVLNNKASDYHSQVFTSTREVTDDKVKWSDPTALNDNINREGFHIGNIALSEDGKSMYFTRVVLDGSVMAESKIFYSAMGSDGWGPATEVTGVNGDFVVKQPAMGKLFGGNVLFFVSDMDGGYGGYDLYYATKNSETDFSAPINLGNVVNTAGDEETPFYLEGSLFFSSTGHPGMGGFDIFSATWDGKVFETPVNMGKGYNSPADDLYLTLDSEGYNGFLVSNREGTRSVKSKTCCNDIWTVNKEKVVLGLNAMAFSEGNPLKGVSFELIPTVDNMMGESQSKSSPATNNAAFTLAKETMYTVIAKAEGYYPDTITFTTVGVETSQMFEEKLNLRPLPPPPPEIEYEEYTENQPIRLNNIYYDLDDDKILPAAEPDLMIIQDLMGEYPDMVIELASHTDAQGTTGYNQKLSQRRAESAKAWLVAKGIAPERIKAVGYGESQILNQCVNGVRCSDEEHRFNRRTNFSIISGPTSIKISKKRLKKKD